MDKCELDPLDELLLAAAKTDENKIITKELTLINEDTLFLSKIAAHELKVLDTPPNISKKSKINNKQTLNVSNNEQSKQTSIKNKSKKANLSLIHTGDTDSSDDESNRDYQNSKYNECGREIKHLLPEDKSKSEFYNIGSTTWQQKRIAPREAIAPLKFGYTTPKREENVLIDPFFGIRISKPLIPSAVLKERMSGRVAISMAKVKNFVTTATPNQDWVIAGAIVQKSNVRTSQNGSQYIIWTLSDLQNDLQTVFLFLFKNAYKELWKTPIGTVVGVLNPSILDNRDGSKHQATLSVDNNQKVMIFGHSKDYGICKSKKKDGEQCTSFVNTNRCSFCIYHVKQEYQKCSMRSDLQSKFAGGGLTALRNKVLGKNEVFYAGKSYMAIPSKKSKKLADKDNKRLLELSKEGVTISSAPVKKIRGVASSLEVSRAQRIKDLQLLQKLNGSTDISYGLDSKVNFDKDDVSASVTLEDSRKAALDVIAKLKSKSITNDASTSTSVADEKADKLFQESPNKSNKINKTLSTEPKLTELNKDTEPSTSKINTENIKRLNTTSDFIPNLSNPEKENKSKTDNIENKETNITQNKNDSLKTKSIISIPNLDIESIVDVSKLKIFKDLQSQPAPKLSHNGNFMIDLNKPINKKVDRGKTTALQWVQKNGPIKKDNPNGTKKSGVKRFLENQAENDPEAKKSKIEEQAQFSSRFRKIMEMTSKHADLLDQRDNDEEEKYFNKLEMREKMEEKMMSTFKVQCKAVKCLNCKYTSFSAAARCKEEKHVLKVFDAMKRFFKCGNCGNRTVSLEICPMFSCKQCGSSKWERTTMMKEKKVHIGEGLSIRGGDQKFVNSVATNANINLLVPDD